MNWSLDFKLSLLGLFMGIATTYFIPSTIEPLCWLVIFIFSAWQIAKHCQSNFFLNGIATSLFNCIWITGSHVILFHDYAARHLPEMEMMAKWGRATHPRQMMITSGIAAGLISGVVLGLFCMLASSLMKKRTATV
jgi:hypothetical protein